MRTGRWWILIVAVGLAACDGKTGGLLVVERKDAGADAAADGSGGGGGQDE